MAREGLRFELGSTFQKALRQKKAVTAKGLKVGTNGGTQTVDITVQAIEEPAALKGMVMIVFTDVATSLGKGAKGRSKSAASGDTRSLELEQELDHEALRIGVGELR